MIIIDHELGYSKRSQPIVPLGAAGEWDDYFVYASARAVINGVEHVYYSGTRNVGANPRLEGSVGLATSVDGGLTFQKQGIVIHKDDVPGLGLSPFGFITIDGLHYLFVTVFGLNGDTYVAGYLTSTDGLAWGPFTALPGLYGGGPAAGHEGTHGACPLLDPHDPTKLFVYYTPMVTPRTRRATFATSDLSVCLEDIEVTKWPCIYPAVQFRNGVFELVVARGNVNDGYMLYRSVSRDGRSFPDITNMQVIPRGGFGAFDEHYTTTPVLFDGGLHYSGRKTDNLGYRGIGRADLAPVGSVLDWDWIVAGVGKIQLPNNAGWGMRLVPGSKGHPAAWLHTRGVNVVYEAVIYDDMSQAGLLQNTMRLTDIDTVGPLIGIWCGVSKTHYTYRTTGGAWLATSIPRSAGLHHFTMEVTPTEITMKIDGVTVATDTVFDTSAYFQVGMTGYWKADAPTNQIGTALVKQFSVTPLVQEEEPVDEEQPEEPLTQLQMIWIAAKEAIMAYGNGVGEITAGEMADDVVARYQAANGL